MMSKPHRSETAISTHDHRASADGQGSIGEARSRSSSRIAPERPVSVRFEPQMIERLDRVSSQLSKLNTNIRIGRSSVVKLAMERALAEIEAELSIVST
jgi:hypothetical protein